MEAEHYKRTQPSDDDAFVRSQFGFKFRKRPRDDEDDADMLDSSLSPKSPASVESASPKTPHHHADMDLFTAEHFRPRVYTPLQRQQRYPQQYLRQQRHHQQPFIEEDEQPSQPTILSDTFSTYDTPYKKSKANALPPLYGRLTFDDDASNTSMSSRTTDQVDLNTITSPPLDVPARNFYKYIPPHLSHQLRTKLILYWSVQRTQQRMSHNLSTITATTGSKQLDRKIRTVMTEASRNLMERIKKGDILMSKNLGNLQLSPKKPNPVNEQAKEKVAELEKAIQVFKAEKEEWHNLSVKLFKRHAAIKDQTLALESASSVGNQSEAKDELIGTMNESEMMQHLDAEFRNFHIDIGATLPAVVNSETEGYEAKIDAAITELRRIFFVINGQLEEMKPLTSKKIAQLAMEMRDERMARIPVPEGRPQPTPAQLALDVEEAEKIRKDNFYLGVMELLRAFTRLQNVPSTFLKDDKQKSQS